MKNARLEEFRQVAYKYLGRAKDATFELTDAILLTRNVYSLADLSLSPVFRDCQEISSTSYCLICCGEIV